MARKKRSDTHRGVRIKSTSIVVYGEKHDLTLHTTQNFDIIRFKFIKKAKKLMNTEEIKAKKQQKIQEVVRQFALKAAAMNIESNIALTNKQLNLLKQIHVLAINRALCVPEVMRDPRKIVYYANDELKLGLAAILMTHVLINHLSKAKYTEDFFLEHISVYTNPEGTIKRVDLQDVEDKIFKASITDEIVYDWMIYRAPGSRGIRALSDEKTFAQGLKNFASGLSPVSEFSRFQRKYFEEKQKKTKDDRESAQKAFRNTFVQQVAAAAAKQLLASKDPTELAKLLFASKDYEAEIQNMLSDMPINAEIENLTQKLKESYPALEDKTSDSLFKALSDDEKSNLMMLEFSSKQKSGKSR